MRNHFLTLDAARGVAAVLVLMMHVGLRYKVPLAPAGYLAVDFFFLLSGFVVASAYEGRLKDGMTFRAFAAVRLRRLYPLYIAGTLISVAYGLLGAAMARRPLDHPLEFSLCLLAAVFMAPGYLPGVVSLYPLNGPAWSLFFEVVANAVYGRFIRWLSNPVLLALMAFGLAVCVAAVMVFDDLAAGARWEGGWAGFGRVSLSFFGGVLLFRLRKARPSKPSNIGPLVVIAVLAAAIVAVAGHGAFDLPVVILVFPALVWFGAEVQPTGLFAALSARAGTLSYALYATHIPVLEVLSRLLSAGHAPKALAVALSLLIPCVVAWLADRFWDGPIRRWLSAKPMTEAPQPAALS